MSDPSENDAQEVKPSQPGQINIKISTAEGDECWFKVKRSTKMIKIMRGYLDKVGKLGQGMRFSYEGVRVQDEDTPDSLGMEDEDALDALVEQQGGLTLSAYLSHLSLAA